MLSSHKLHTTPPAVVGVLRVSLALLCSMSHGHKELVRVLLFWFFCFCLSFACFQVPSDLAATLKGHNGAVLSLCALPNGRIASGGGNDDKTIRVWE